VIALWVRSIVETGVSERKLGGSLTVELEVATCYIGLHRDAECQELTAFCHSLTKCG
jgi:hypothetical protein